MTLADFDKKIEELKLIRSNAIGMKKAELTDLIDELETKRTIFITQSINETNFGFTQGDINELNEIANTFETATEEITEANDLIDNAIRLGQKLVALF